MRRIHLALLGLALNLALLLPGLLLPVLKVTGNLQPEGIAHIAPTLLDAGVSEESVKSLKPLLNPALTAMLGDDAKIKEKLLGILTSKIVDGLTTSASQIEVYVRERSIVGTVQHLYESGSPLAATLIMTFSVLVPLGKIILVLWTWMQTDSLRRLRGGRVLAAIKKWSMADVFAVALFIAYLAAKATQDPPSPGDPPNIVTFDAKFGSGFYWFTAYCLISIATHHVTVKSLPK